MVAPFPVTARRAKFERTRLSLYFPLAYLFCGGVALLLAPRSAMALMFSNGDYGDTFPRYVGVLSLGLAMIVMGIMQYRVAVLYTTLIAVRVLFCVSYIVFYWLSRDPFFIAMLVMVGTGAVATSLTWVSDRRR